GAGLGIRFLKHLERTRLLLHIVDASPDRPVEEVVDEIRIIAGELSRYSPALEALPRWLVLNKLDLLPADERSRRVDEIATACGWTGPVYGISALAKEGTDALARDCMRFLETLRRERAERERAMPETGRADAPRGGSGHR